MNIAFGLTKRALGCSGVVLDTLYEVTGRRVELLRLGAEMLYDLSRLGQPATRGDEAQDAPEEVAEAKEQPSPSEAKAEDPAAAQPEAEPADDAASEHLNGAAHPQMEEAAEVTSEQEEATAEPETVELEDTEEVAAATDDEAEFPIEGYDALNVRKVELEMVMAYEQAHKGRKTVVRAVERRLDSL